MSEVRLLPTEFENKDGQFKQVYKDDNFYIYERLFFEVLYYEVFKRRVVDCFDFETKQPTGERKETYPNNPENFGVWAWCCDSIESAQKYTTEKQIQANND